MTLEEATMSDIRDEIGRRFQHFLIVTADIHPDTGETTTVVRSSSYLATMGLSKIAQVKAAADIGESLDPDGN